MGGEEASLYLSRFDKQNEVSLIEFILNCFISYLSCFKIHDYKYQDRIFCSDAFVHCMALSGQWLLVGGGKSRTTVYRVVRSDDAVTLQACSVRTEDDEIDDCRVMSICIVPHENSVGQNHDRKVLNAVAAYSDGTVRFGRSFAYGILFAIVAGLSH
jgi:hypothetical protein